MSFPRLNRLGLSLCLAAGCLFTEAIQAQESDPIQGFTLRNRYRVGAVAEIISANPEGDILAYTNAGEQLIGLLDISEPEFPEELGTVDVSDLGEPTSVVITPDGQYAVAAVLDLIDEEAGETIADQQLGHLVVIDLESQERVGQVELNGIGPDSVAITPDGERVLVAIEDEEDEDNLPGDRPGSIDIVALDVEDPKDSEVTTLELDLEDVEGVNYPEDPQPEFISINPEGSLAAVSLQENNAIAILDLESEEVRIFSAGTSSHDADLTEDGMISLTEDFEGRREPDTIAFTPDGEHLVLLNEGDTDLDRFGDDIWSGGRGWSIVDLEGNVVYDSGSDVEELAVLRGQYPEGRSENRGVEMEGGTSARFGDQDLAFVASERGSFLLAYDLSDLEAPELISFLPTGLAPEGILALPEQGLLISANEDDGTIDIFEASTEPVDPYTETEPLVIASSLDTPYSAISGKVAVPDRTDALYAVPDNAIAPSQIYTLELDGNRAEVTESLILTLDDQPAVYDLEGVAVDPDEEGFWLVSEGDNREGRERPNLLIQTDSAGRVQEEIELPAEDAASITRFGFEGVTTNEDGSQVFVAVQREFEGDPENQVRIYRYSVEAGNWDYFFYPLDDDNVAGWVGLSEIAYQGDESFLVIERDNQGGANGAANARVKRVYEFSLEEVEPESLVEKTLVVDLLEEHNWIEEKAEGLAIVEEGFWVSSDNDGGETYTRLLLIER